ncbi:hypothetical protein BDP27DRAFT_1364734 [Rhodocollybia butyracea]|uniref:Uncharacterized protein n=1 Tax=Rhodocollybia butyracea TaxID=206335 RepID=A0A9P5U6D9_9AGAR|nr:hypothetical protein BDP27DRAFT_1364734 [Rhodocollybia butyracea]
MNEDNVWKVLQPPQRYWMLRVQEHTERYLDPRKKEELRYLLLLWMCHGFHIHKAAGDASVALWQIDKQVNTIMTEDIRVLVLVPYCHSILAFFSNEDLSQCNKRLVTPHGIFLLLILMGSDYANGLPVFTAEIAYALMNTALKSLLIFAAEDFAQAPLRLQEYLPTWKDALENEIKSNTHEFLPSALPNLAECIWMVPNFPSFHVTYLAQPTIMQATPFPAWLVQPPDLAAIAKGLFLMSNAIARLIIIFVHQYVLLMFAAITQSPLQNYQIDLVMNGERPIVYSKAKLLLLPPLSTVGVICLHHTLANKTDAMETDEEDMLEVKKLLL